jgi:hypothetical protein
MNVHGIPRRSLSENLKGRDHRITQKMYPKEVRGDGVDWIELIHVTVHCRALVNEVMNLRPHKR